MIRHSVLTALVGAAALAAPASAAAAGYQDAVLQDHPLAFYRLDETAGVTAADASPNHRDATYDATAAVGRDGAFLQSSHAVGLAGGAKIAGDVDAASGSVELWVNPKRLRRGEQAGYVAHGNPAGDGWALGVGAKRRLTFVTGGKALSLRTNVPAGTWTQLTTTWSGGTVRVYVNGALTQSLKPAAAAPVSSDHELVIGAKARGAFTGNFAGSIDEVALYDHAVDAAAVQAHLAAAKVPVNVAPPRVTGTPAVGEALTVAPGTWSLATSGPAYQWQACDAAGADCDLIDGAAAATYVPGPQDAGATLQVIETVTNLAGSMSATSAPTAPVVDPNAASGGGTGGTTTTDPGTSPAGTDGTVTGTTGTTTTGTAPTPGTAGTTAGTTAGATGATTTGTAGTASGTTAGTSPTCLRLVSRQRRARIRRVGVLRLLVARNGCIRAGAPLRVTLKANRGVRMRSLGFRLDGKRVRTAGRLRPAKLTPARLRPGRHVLRVRVTPRGGKARTVTLRLRTARR